MVLLRKYKKKSYKTRYQLGLIAPENRGSPDLRKFGQTECFGKALEIKPKHGRAWLELEKYLSRHGQSSINIGRWLKKAPQIASDSEASQRTADSNEEDLDLDLIPFTETEKEEWNYTYTHFEMNRKQLLMQALRHVLDLDNFFDSSDRDPSMDLPMAESYGFPFEGISDEERDDSVTTCWVDILIELAELEETITIRGRRFGPAELYTEAVQHDGTRADAWWGLGVRR